MANSIKLMLELPMPAVSAEPVKQKSQEPKTPEVPVEDRVKEALDCIDSGHDSKVEWSMINRLYRDLKALKKPNDRARNLIKMIEPVLSKYGYHKVPAGAK